MKPLIPTSLSLLFVLLFSCGNPVSSPKNGGELEKRSSPTLGKPFHNASLSLDSLSVIVEEIEDQDVKLQALLDLAKAAYQADRPKTFRHWNEKVQTLSLSISDTFSLAESFRYVGNYTYRKNQYDSSYHYFNRARNLYTLIDDKFAAGRVLLNMATIQRNVKDYLGSEVATTKAIELLKPLQEHKELYLAYNNLGIIYNELDEHEQSLKYHREALAYQNALGDLIYRASTLNNLGVVHEKKEEYLHAIANYEEALQLEGIPQKNPRLYAMLLGNKAYSLLRLGKTEESKPLFDQALQIRDSIGHQSGISINKIHLGEYYLKQQDTLKAIKLITEARELARESRNYTDLLRSLVLLGKIDKPRSKENLLAYISIDDSLQKKERAVRNRFARIRFETDEFIAQNETLTRQRKMIFGGSVVSVGILLMVFIIFIQRHRNRQLRLEQAQQKSNEEIYNLLLVQHEKLEEGRNREKKRISQELHDGILGKIFGIRFMLNSLYDKTDAQSVQNKKRYLEDLKGIEEEIRNISHNLNQEFLSSQVSFVKIMDEFLEDHKKVTGLDFTLDNDQNIKWEEVNSKIKINLYRIVQEAIFNTTKHSRASSVDISFHQEREGSISMLITDNGQGFDREKITEGIGLKNMKSRVKSLDGSLRMGSSPKGTRITINIPNP